MRQLTLLGALALLAGALALPGAAAADPALTLDVHHDPTHFSPPVAGSIVTDTIVQGSVSPPVNEVQEVVVEANEGTFTLSFEGETTTELGAGAASFKVRNALAALASIGKKANVEVSGEPKPFSATYRIEFSGELAATDVPQIEGADGAKPLSIAEAAYTFDVRNVGDLATSGTITVALRLPEGLGYKSGGGSFRLSDVWASALGVTEPKWSCSEPEAALVRCTTAGPIPRHTLNDGLFVKVSVDPAVAGSEPTATATVAGGGAPEAPEVSDCPAGAAACAAEPTAISYEPATFGIPAASFQPGFFTADGQTPVLASGAHPDLLLFPFDFNSVVGKAADPFVPVGHIRDISVDLPPGFIGNPSAVEECSQALFTLGECPGSSQVGRIDVKVTGFPPEKVRIGVFNLNHPRGAITDIAFAIAANPVHVKAHLDPANHYAITTTTANINETVPPLHQQLTFWGTPGDSSHDDQRCRLFQVNVFPSDQQNGDTSSKCKAEQPQPEPFLTVPSSCTQENVIRLRDYDSWEETGHFGPELDHSLPARTECDRPRFDPSVSIEPTGHRAGEPTGLDVHVHVPQEGLVQPNAPATPPVRSTVVTLPAGMALNPAFADGLSGCSEARFGISHAGVPDGAAVACPDNSRIGEVELRTPLLPNPVEGSMYLAEQRVNPFGSLIAFYLALHDTEERGVLVKVGGKVELDPGSGRITTSFEELPQFPFEDLTLKFRSGPRAPLVNPPTCGVHTIAATMTSYARPGEQVDASGSYALSEGPGGGPCSGGLSGRPFEPAFLAGTENPVAGAFSPLAARVTRSDSDQELSGITATAPPGLIASLREVGRCPEAQIAVAISRNAPGEGQLERRSPSCPSSSQVGTVVTGAGAGPDPIYISGKIYLAGPYEGAPLSGVAIVPAVAGPVDLGVVVVRAPAFIDPRTAQVTLRTDPLPQIVNGVLVRVRDVRIDLDRPGFTLNPTSCRQKSIDATLRSAEGALKDRSQRFQVGECASLGFKPRLAISLDGGTHRGAHPALRAVVRPRPGDANFARAAVALPRSAFLDQAHIRTVCTRVQFAAGEGNGARCPAGAIYGFARAVTPLLSEPFEGPVFLRSSNHKLPDLVIALHGPASLPIKIELSARIDSIRGGIRSSFEAIPDVPVSRFVLRMRGARKGLIVNSTNLCRGRHNADADLSGQNGRRDRTRPAVRAVRCGKSQK